MTEKEKAGIGDCMGQRPNQRARLLEPKCSFSDRMATEGSWYVPVGEGPEKKSTSTRPIRPAPNSM